MEPKAANTAGEEALQPKAGWVERSSRFLKEVRFEMERVTWPTWKETKAATIVVVVFVLVVAMVLGAFDMLMRLIIGRLIGG